MGKLYVLIGRSAVGKSTIEKILSNKGISRVISTTTRPIREGEIDGIDYHYVTKDVFENMLANDELLEHATYRDWNYGLSTDSITLEMLKEKDYVCVLEKEGYYQVREKLGQDNVIGIYLYLNDTWELLHRSLMRQPHCNEDACVEICRRFIADKEDFKEVAKHCILRINNIDTNDTVDIIRRFIQTNG